MQQSKTAFHAHLKKKENKMHCTHTQRDRQTCVNSKMPYLQMANTKQSHRFINGEIKNFEEREKKRRIIKIRAEQIPMANVK